MAGENRSAGCVEYRRVSRRGMLTAGALGALGLSLSDLLRMRAATAAMPARPGSSFGKAKNVILLWMQGGVSHHETFDPKPDAPADVRGEFSTVETRLPGVRFCDQIPRLAKIADRLAVVRSLSHPDASHDGADYLVLKGFRAQAGVTHPDLGCVLMYERRPRTEIPPYVLVPGKTWSSGIGWQRFQPGYLPAWTAGWHLNAEPSDANFKVPDIALQPMLTDGRLGRRESLLASVEKQSRCLSDAAEGAGADPFYDRAFTLLTSLQIRRAFDIAAEPAPVRDEYGRTRLGQRCLMARRLIEAGSTFVVVDDDSWDHHSGIFQSLKSPDRLPQFDRAFATLIVDLERRGLLAETLVVYLTEFGRTPKVNKDAGRDHWPGTFSMFFAGAGVKAGQVVGRSDETGAYPAERPVRPGDVIATLFHLVGIDPDAYVASTLGQPMRLVSEGCVLPEIV